MSTYLFVRAEDSILEDIAEVSAGTCATLTKAYEKLHNSAQETEDEREYDATVHAADTQGYFHLLGNLADGLGRLEGYSIVERAGLDGSIGNTTDREIVRELLVAQKAHARERHVIGATPAEVTEMNKRFLMIVDKLIAKVDAGAPIGLAWS